MGDFSQTLTVNGQDCPFDPENNLIQIYCSNCGHLNEVPCYVDKDGNIDFDGFVCENCGAYNAPEM